MRNISRDIHPYLAIVLLLFIVLAVYWQAGGNAFLGYDDDDYVTVNPSVLRGLTRESVSWAFTTFHVANWHPLTWLSHMADVELFGLDAGWHHRVNVLIHLVNTVLLFLVLWRMTGGLWQSAFVAALFGVHPLHVESVAWVAERKDLLSTLFWFLTMGAYTRYARSPGIGRYVPVALFLALGLMCKPMLVTLPFVLLLLDFWPLQRYGEGPFSMRAVSPLLLEKIPLLVLSAASCVLTYLAQSRGFTVISLGSVPVGARISNAIVSYVAYLGKTVWPGSLAVYYPHPAFVHAGIPTWQVAGSVLLLGAATLLALRQRKCHPYLLVGWLWYLGTLVPVIGLVQVGTQALADRYTYVPLIGVFMIVAWGVPEALRGWRFRRQVLGAIGGAVILALGITAWIQARHWRDGVSLFRHALNVTENNWVIWYNLGVTYQGLGQPGEALACFRKSVRIVPEFAGGWVRVGSTYDDLGQYQEAIASYREAIRVSPNYFKAWDNLGVVYDNLGRHLEAIACYRESIRIKPDNAMAWYNLGVAYSRLRQPQEAVKYYEEASRINPGFAGVWYALGVTYNRLGKPEQAREAYQRLLPISPELAQKLLETPGSAK